VQDGGSRARERAGGGGGNDRGVIEHASMVAWSEALSSGKVIHKEIGG
jgi:hypothetical protein